MKSNLAPRILLSLLGSMLILWGIGSLALGVIGERDIAVITSFGRQGGERTDGTPGRYTYSMGYTFTLPDGWEVDGSVIKIGGAVYTKAGGTVIMPVRYLKVAPFINTPEEDTKLSFAQPALVGAGVLLIVLINGKNLSSGRNL